MTPVQTSILFVIVGIVGIVMASIGINFYNKCKNGTELADSSKNFLIILLVGFSLLIIGVVVMEAYKKYPSAPGGAQFAALQSRLG